MSVIDIIILIIVLGFVFYGLFFGLVRTFGSLVGVIVGFWLAWTYWLPVYGWLKNLFFGYENFGKVITFIILFTVANRLIGFIFALIDRAIDLLSIIPFLKTINRLAGAVLGFIEAGIVLGLVFILVANYTTPDSWLISIINQSKFTPYLIKFAKIFTPLLPELINQVKGLFKT